MIFNMTGGGSGGAGGGATLVVSCPANVTVTVSKENKTYTKNSGSLGSATFKGLSTGTWSVTIQSSSQTATKNITITSDYAITMTFFAAYINITYPANSNCVVTNSGGQTVASDTNAGSSTKTWTAVVGTTGTYTVTATDGSGRSKSQSVSITADGQSVSVTLSYELVLFNNGNDNASVTGGWRHEHYYASEQSFIINNNGINLYIYNNDGSGGIEASTNNRISLSNYKTLNVKVSNISKGTCYLGVSSNQNISASNNYTALNSGTTPGTYTIDISSISDSLYIKLKIISNHSEGASMTISEVWLG